MDAYPHLQSFVSEDNVNLQFLHAHLSDLTLERANNTLGAEGDCLTNPQAAKARAQALGKWISLWSSKRRKICALAILDANGNPADSNAGSAKLLYDHWSQVFAAKPVNLFTAKASISQYIQVAPSNIDWDPTFVTFFGLLILRKDTGCGPDGIP